LSLDAYLARERDRIDRELDRVLPAADGPSATVARAMRHAVLGGGKRLRAIVLMASFEACGGRGDTALEPACAIELIHTYSLVHDDLPAMDDDDLRRDRPTVHKAYGEAAAILAGDALLALAFEILGRRPGGDAAAPRRSEAVTVAAAAAGHGGMVGGQIADLESERKRVDPEMLRWIHLHKTAALFSASCRIGAIHADAVDERRDALATYGRRLGLAFQIADDLLDQTASRETLGKTPGKDKLAGKATYPALLGASTSRGEAERLTHEARQTLDDAGILTGSLAGLAGLVLERAHR
jgi:geranylgeranyl diphosphate synthase type II